MLPALYCRFGEVTLTVEERKDLFAASHSHLYRMITYTLSMVGMSLTPQCSAEFRISPVGFTFFHTDLLDSDVRVKHMSILDYVRAQLLLMQPSFMVASNATAGTTIVNITNTTATRINPIDATASSLSPLSSQAQFAASTAAIKRCRTPHMHDCFSWPATASKMALRSDTLNYPARREFFGALTQAHEMQQQFSVADNLLLSSLQKLVNQALISPLFRDTLPALLDTLLEL